MSTVSPEYAKEVVEKMACECVSKGMQDKDDAARMIIAILKQDQPEVLEAYQQLLWMEEIDQMIGVL